MLRYSSTSPGTAPGLLVFTIPPMPIPFRPAAPGAKDANSSPLLYLPSVKRPAGRFEERLLHANLQVLALAVVVPQ